MSPLVQTIKKRMTGLTKVKLKLQYVKNTTNKIEKIKTERLLQHYEKTNHWFS